MAARITLPWGREFASCPAIYGVKAENGKVSAESQRSSKGWHPTHLIQRLDTLCGDPQRHGPLLQWASLGFLLQLMIVTFSVGTGNMCAWLVWSVTQRLWGFISLGYAKYPTLRRTLCIIGKYISLFSTSDQTARPLLCTCSVFYWLLVQYICILTMLSIQFVEILLTVMSSDCHRHEHQIPVSAASNYHCNRSQYMVT